MSGIDSCVVSPVYLSGTPRVELCASSFPMVSEAFRGPEIVHPLRSAYFSILVFTNL
jgi:hypothetical protein